MNSCKNEKISVDLHIKIIEFENNFRSKRNCSESEKKRGNKQ
jgi:hypothetical protein